MVGLQFLETRGDLVAATPYNSTEDRLHSSGDYLCGIVNRASKFNTRTTAVH